MNDQINEIIDDIVMMKCNKSMLEKPLNETVSYDITIPMILVLIDDPKHRDEIIKKAPPMLVLLGMMLNAANINVDVLTRRILIKGLIIDCLKRGDEDFMSIYNEMEEMAKTIKKKIANS